MIVLSYNVEYGLNLDEIFQWIKTLNKKPHIICFQEFPEKEISSLEKNKIFKNQETFFTKGLTNKNEFFGELTIIDISVVKVIDVKYIDFGLAHFESIYKRKILKRSAIISKVGINDKEISVANVHLTPASIHGIRRKQLLKVIENINSENAIILGDFNYSSLLNKGGLIKFMEKYNYSLSGEKLITNKYKYKIPQQLDYVFYKNLKHLKTEVFDLPHSDHFPVIAELEI